jgi:hypothetical protein
MEPVLARKDTDIVFLNKILHAYWAFSLIVILRKLWPGASFVVVVVVPCADGAITDMHRLRYFHH